MKDITKLLDIIRMIEEGFDATESDKLWSYTYGKYGEDGHVGDDDEDVTGMMWIEEELPDGTTRTWNVRVKLDD